MKALILLLLVSSSAWSRSVVPSLVVLNPLNLYSKSNKLLPSGDMEVRAVDFSRRGSFLYNKKKILVPQEDFESFKATANAVQRMIPDESDTEESTRRGTAFHIGSNLVLTNAHVLGADLPSTPGCADFRLTDYQDINYTCKEVLYCSIEHDVCLIEMNTVTKNVRGTPKTFALADGPTLKIKLNYQAEIKSTTDEVITTAIGNSGGQGIHYSQGKGIIPKKDKLYFYAPITQGNSGGPLLNSENEVIGVVKQQTKITRSDDRNVAYNIALPSDLTVELIRKALEKNTVMLRKFNQAVIE